MNNEINKENYKTFDEVLAKKIMEVYYKNIYSDLINLDSPDIQSANASVGIEVTNAEKQELHEIKAHVNSVLNKSDSDLTENDKKNIKKGEIESIYYLNNKIVSAGPPAYWGSDFDFETIINKKLKKLNSMNYSKFNTNCLFIYANGLDRFDISADNTLDIIKNIDYSKYEISFDIIYIFTFSLIIEYHTKEPNFIFVKVDRNIIKKIVDETRTFILSNNK